MDLNKISQAVSSLERANEWQELHHQILEHHESASSSEVYEKLLEQHKILLDKVEAQFINSVDIDKFKKLRQNEYDKMLLRESTIGGSLCVETLYEVTQRELEAGRMSPTHEFIDISIQATATDHYTRDQLLRQKEKIENIEESSLLNKLTRLLK